MGAAVVAHKKQVEEVDGVQVASYKAAVPLLLTGVEKDVSWRRTVLKDERRHLQAFPHQMVQVVFAEEPPHLPHLPEKRLHVAETVDNVPLYVGDNCLIDVADIRVVA